MSLYCFQINGKILNMADAELSIQILYQAIGIIAMICSCLSFQFKKNFLFLVFQCVACALFSYQFYMTGAWVACIMNGICILRCIFYAFNRGIIKRIIFTVIFCLMFVGAAILSSVKFEENWIISILCCLASIASTIAISTKNNTIIRMAQVTFVSPVWLFNGIFYLSIGGIIAESLNWLSAFIALIKNAIGKKKA